MNDAKESIVFCLWRNPTIVVSNLFISVGLNCDKWQTVKVTVDNVHGHLHASVFRSSSSSSPTSSYSSSFTSTPSAPVEQLDSASQTSNDLTESSTLFSLQRVHDDVIERRKKLRDVINARHEVIKRRSVIDDRSTFDAIKKFRRSPEVFDRQQGQRVTAIISVGGEHFPV